MKRSCVCIFIVVMSMCVAFLNCSMSGEPSDWCGEYEVQSETFDESDRPALEYNAAGSYYLVKPWNYEKAYNQDRKYPLLIYLHGGQQARYIKNLYYMGMGYYYYNPADPNDKDTDHWNKPYEYLKDVADKFRKKYPCFMFVPQEEGSSFDITKLIGQIEQLKNDYRIDTNRIYMHGFSMGGSAAYQLAQEYYEYNGQIFAGIIRFNGGGTTLPDPVVNKTSVWFMVGLNDSSTMVDFVRNGYAFLKNHTCNTGAEEVEKSDYMVGTYRANTVFLKKDGVEFARKTEYPDVGHILITFPFDDPYVFKWLFNQSLENR